MSPVVDWGHAFIRSRGQPKLAMGLRGREEKERGSKKHPKLHAPALLPLIHSYSSSSPSIQVMPYITLIILIPNRIAGASPVRIISPIGISPAIARIRRAYNITRVKQCPHPPTPATCTCIGRWKGITDLCCRYAPSKAFVGTRSPTVRVSAQHVIGGHDACRHG